MGVARGKGEVAERGLRGPGKVGSGPDSAVVTLGLKCLLSHLPERPGLSLHTSQGGYRMARGQGAGLTCEGLCDPARCAGN